MGTMFPINSPTNELFKKKGKIANCLNFLKNF